MQQILLLDNFDSFTYNLEHYLSSLETQVCVVRNNEVVSDIERFDKIVLSPGPGLPINAGNLMSIIQSIDGKIPILGVCLGMQAIAQHLGGELFNQATVKHGVQEKILQSGSILFDGMPEEMEVGLYHSWAVREFENYDITASSENGIVMALENAQRNLYGVQFHPESVMTPNGKTILDNFLKLS